MKYKKIVIKTLCVIVVLLIAMGAIGGFSANLQRTLTMETYRTLSEVSQNYNKAFYDRIAYNTKTLNVLSGSLSSMENSSEEDIKKILENTVKDAGFAKAVVCDIKGDTCSSTGNSKNVSDSEYFKKAMRGETQIVEPLTDIVDGVGVDSIVIAVPIHMLNNAKTIVGVVFGVYPLAVASVELLDSSYFRDGYGFVVSSTGKIMLSSDNEKKLCDKPNFLEFLKEVKMDNYSVSQFEESMKIGESGSFSFSYKKETWYINFTPSRINDWYTISAASDEILLKQERTTNLIVLQLTAGLIIAGALFIFLIVMDIRRRNKEITLANQRYSSLLSNINGGLVVMKHADTIDGTIATYVSKGFTDITGYTIEDIVNDYGGIYVNLVMEADRENSFNSFLEQVAKDNTYRLSYRIIKKDKSIVWIMDNGYLVEDANGSYNHSIITDVTAYKLQEEQLKLSENRFSVAVNASSGAVFEVDLKRQLYTHFENSERIFGVKAEKLLEETKVFSTLPYDEFVDEVTKYFFHPDDRKTALISMAELVENKTASYDARLRRYDDSYIWARIDLSLVLDDEGAPKFLIGYMSDIDEVKKQTEQLKTQVQIDSMTGVYNKAAMETLTTEILENNPTGLFALIVLDIDNFKGINDTLGHAFGDIVLIEVAAKLKKSFRSEDIVARMGGDEFAILMTDVADKNDALKKAVKISADLRQTYAGKKSDYKISCSIGVIMIEGNKESFETFYRKADAALYQAKSNGKDQFVLYQEKDADIYPIESKATNDEELQNLKVSTSIEEQIFELLYTSKDFNINLQMALATIGQLFHVSRVTIFENDYDNNTTSGIYEWCNENISSKLQELKNLPISEGEDSVLDSFDKNGLLYCSDVNEISPYFRKLLIGQEVKSTLQVTIMNDEKVSGFIGFAECNEQRVWTAEEIEKLSFISKVLSVFLFKQKTEAMVLDNLKTRIKILDELPDYICVVNPELHKIEYTNKKMKEMLPDATSGAMCFTTLRGGQNSPCHTCLMERIKRGDTDNLEIVSEDKKVKLDIKALIINWSNDRKMVLLYGSRKLK